MDNPAWTDDIFGMTEAEASVAAKEEGFYMRVIRRDGHYVAVTRDFRDDRINVEVDDHVVTGVKGIG